MDNRWVGRQEFLIPATVDMSLHRIVGDDAKAIAEVLDVKFGKQFQHLYRGLKVVNGGVMGYIVILETFRSTAAFYHLQNGLMGLGLRAEHPLLQVQRPDSRGQFRSLN